MDYQKIIDDLHLTYKNVTNKGKKASYIPELKKYQKTNLELIFSHLIIKVLEQEIFRKNYLSRVYQKYLL